MNWYKKASNYSEMKDFMEEFQWYRDRGVASELTDEEIKKIWTESPVGYTDPVDLDRIGNTYTPEVTGESEEERINKFIEWAKTENREDSAESEWGEKRLRDTDGYLRNLLVSIGRGDYPPVNIVEAEGLGSFIVGGRTRAAAARALDVPLMTRKIKMPWKGNEADKEIEDLFYKLDEKNSGEQK